MMITDICELQLLDEFINDDVSMIKKHVSVLIKECVLIRMNMVYNS